MVPCLLFLVPCHEHCPPCLFGLHVLMPVHASGLHRMAGIMCHSSRTRLEWMLVWAMCHSARTRLEPMLVLATATVQSFDVYNCLCMDVWRGDVINKCLATKYTRATTHANVPLSFHIVHARSAVVRRTVPQTAYAHDLLSALGCDERLDCMHNLARYFRMLLEHAISECLRATLRCMCRSPML